MVGGCLKGLCAVQSKAFPQTNKLKRFYCAKNLVPTLFGLQKESLPPVCLFVCLSLYFCLYFYHYVCRTALLTFDLSVSSSGSSMFSSSFETPITSFLFLFNKLWLSFSPNFIIIVFL